MADVLDGLDVTTLRDQLSAIIHKAERNKAFRDDTYGTFRVAAIDGWEPFCTYERHCDGCLTRTVKRAADDGTTERVTQYYHRFVVAFLIAPTVDMVLAIEPILSADLRDDDVAEGRHEGELTAALRLIDQLHERYGGLIDALALDGLNACGPVLTKLTAYGYGGFCALLLERMLFARATYMKFQSARTLRLTFGFGYRRCEERIECV